MTVYDPKDGALPVSGYKPQTSEKVDIVNGFKADEERILRKLDQLADTPTHHGQVDKSWLAIGRTQLEQAFMAINRSVFQPGRVSLPEDEVPSVKDRVKAERAALADNLTKLRAYIDGGCKGASFEQATLLGSQAEQMAAYLATLDARLKDFAADEIPF